ncbi:sensor histidine kinase [Rhodococcus maanshanensis]|uniref:Two-component system, NarL family, sensor kinase n=1 Tax=Rhodococcus maanshanensis TaxID=183556 RepID=A0A1H7RE60_9NOCA|nr:ATP-binding protein [Rhodococcus maanshanensis]SEL58234.1 two-component system, NarL family, sensor kinase [Rhodococcus maanshanensis]
MAGRDRDRVVERYATEAVRVTAFLRLPLIALIALLGPVVRIEHWMPTVFRLVLLGYAVAAAVWLVVVLRRQVRPWAGWASTGVDIAALLALCLASGGATSSLLPVFFLLPVAVAFQYRPALTACLGTCTAVGYLLVWIFYAVRDDLVDLPGVVFLYFGFLLWLTAATTALSFVLVRRSGTVIALLDVRRQLVAESMGAEERERRRLAEHLHDGPLQNVLAARMDLEEAIERDRDPALVAAEAALRETATQLRSTVTTLHPQVLEQLGLTAALRELAEGYGRRGYEMRVRLAEVGRPECQSLLYRVAREALGNIDRHAHATRVELQLARTATAITLEVADDGVGFDPGDLPARVAEGHIGLASQFLRIENLGGTLELTSAPGEGTRVLATIPSP